MAMTRRTSVFRRSRRVRPELASLGLFALVAALSSGCGLVADADAGPSAAPSGRVNVAAALTPPPRSARAEATAARASCPPEMTQVEGFCVDRHEAHLVVAAADGTFAVHPPHERPLGAARYVARSAPGVMPQAYISRVESASACENAGKRLCSVVEWSEACRGPRGATYPYGRKYEARRCNVGKPHLLSRLFGTNAKAWRYDEHFNDPRLNQLPGFLAKTGDYEGCVSDHGAFDMVGNLHEWVSDRADASLALKLPLKDGIRRALGKNRGKGVFMGGFFSTTSEHGRGCSFVTAAHEPRYHDYSTGFRCCKDAAAP